jgi:hypothetical protein
MAEPAAEVAELAAEPAAEVMDASAEVGAPTTEEMSPRMEETRPPWAAAPAARKVVATTEKRILMRVVGYWLS